LELIKLKFATKNAMNQEFDQSLRSQHIFQRSSNMLNKKSVGISAYIQSYFYKS